MSELSYKELQEQGVFDVPYRAFEFMQEQQKKIENMHKLGFQEGFNSRQSEIKRAVLSLRNEFNLWADDNEQFHAIEAQIEQLEELLK